MLKRMVISKEVELVSGAVDDLDGGDGVGSAELAEGKGFLPLKARRRYAKAKSIFEVGLWSAKSIDNVLGVMIGSTAGVRNSYAELRQDNRNMRKELAKMGLVYEDCRCGELSPESHEFRKRDGTIGVTVGELWHSHGFFKFEYVMQPDDLHSVLSPLWGKIHGSQVVDIKIQHDVDKSIKYSVKDAVKNFVDSSNECQGRRLLMSAGWLPAGYRKVDKLLTKWALHHGANWRIDDDVDEFLGGDYIAYAWEIKRDYLRRWCQGETLMLDFGDYYCFIQGENIKKLNRREANYND